MQKRKITPRIWLPLLLYAIPILFISITYLLMVVTGEDLFQGANTNPNIIEDALAAFQYNARLSDMYAWGIINIFDYTFSFGPDTIIRIIDILLSVGIIYLISVIILGRRPKLQTSDAMLFSTIFLAIYLSTLTSSLLMAWSHIHNYLIIGFFSMLFFLPFALKLQRKKVPNDWKFKITMLITGFLFGFASNVTPIAFLATIICISIIALIRSKNKINLRKILLSWEAAAVIGIIAACILMYGVGHGFSTYKNMEYSSVTDYIPLGTILTSPLTATAKIANHIIANLFFMMPGILLLGAALGIEALMHAKKIINSKNNFGIHFVGSILVFVILHILVMSQIKIETIQRLSMPAYFMVIAGTLFTTVRTAAFIDIPKAVCIASTTCVLVISLAALIDMTHFKIQYHHSASQLFEKIQKSNTQIVCITPGDNPKRTSSYLFNFPTYPILQDWTMISPIFGKIVNYCE